MVASSPLVSSTSTVQVPHVHMYDPQTHTLIMRDLAPARLLSTVLIESLANHEPARILELSSQIGSALGEFMGRFHQWTSLPEQSALRARFSENLVSREVVLAYRHQLMLESAVKFGLEQSWMEGVVQDGIDDARQGGPVIAMGDFWFGKRSNNFLYCSDFNFLVRQCAGVPRRRSWPTDIHRRLGGGKVHSP